MRAKFKYSFFLIIVFTGISVKAQSSDWFKSEFKGNIKSIVEKSVKYPDSWREFEFDNFYRLKEKRYFRENKLVQKENWDYIDNDSLLTIKKLVNNEVYIEKFYVDANGKTKRHEIFSSKDTVSAWIIFTNFVYDGDYVLKYNRLLINRQDTITELYAKKYSRDKLTVTLKKTDDKGINSFTQTMKYDKKGNLMSEVIDYNNPEVVLAGVRTWSRRRHDKYRIDYKYDKRGNWIERCAVTWLRKYKIEERIIKYEE